MIGLEEPGHWGGLVDLEAAVDGETAGLVAELRGEPSGEEVALRGGARYVARLRRRPAAGGGGGGRQATGPT